jgi:hypothetical protein
MFRKSLIALTAFVALPAYAVTNVNSTDCRFFVENALWTSQSVYGSSSEYFLFSLKVPESAVAMGMYARSSDGREETSETIMAYTPDYTSGRPQNYLSFSTLRNSDGTNRSISLLDFAFFYDTVENGETIRHWFKDDWQNFSGSAVAASNYAYTDFQYWGYGQAHYLRHDSGSPLFYRLNSCSR